MQIRKHSTLAKLTEDQQEHLFDWLETFDAKQVLEMLAKSPPEGLGIRTHITTLRRFYAGYQASHNEEEILAAEILKTPVPGADSVKDATAATLQRIALRLATSPGSKLSQFKALTRYTLKLNEHDHRRAALELMKQRLELDTKKFQFNAARSALQHFLDLQLIIQNQTLDDEDKIRAARKKMFGENLPD